MVVRTATRRRLNRLEHSPGEPADRSPRRSPAPHIEFPDAAD
ncbi:hypothetical protein BURMUCGD2M_5133 [Burkholderia multivorans CGD2M]|uniref:Uncharacterized protein n=1 Tax=Burkholderia multivorans CGD2 TaxID=513052 RepID=B9BJ84_9BURK|nr:hypothetical protein BURMUCGD2_5140 [Burkholderia multivorans CGD2]EEE15690.1 hypothetical protein BURMUCGD2M_5133 [Burkholderia multivorans CGD2M]